jgi:hypothetical protein
MPGLSRLALKPTILQAATTDPFTGRALTAARPFTVMEKYRKLNLAEGVSRGKAPGAVRAPMGRGGRRPLRPFGEVMASYAPDDGRRIGSKLGAQPALTAADYISANGGLSNPAASKRVGSLTPFYERNPQSDSDLARKQLLGEAADFVAVGDDSMAPRRTPYGRPGGMLLAANGRPPAAIDPMTGQPIPGYASGGVIPEDQVAVVGEAGPELVRSTGPTAVVPLAPTAGMGEGRDLSPQQMWELGYVGAQPEESAPGMGTGMLPAPRSFSDPLLPAVPAAGQGRALVPWQPPPRENLGQPAAPGAVPVLNPTALDPWVQTKVNHIAQRELLKNPLGLVQMQMGIESEAAKAQAAAQQVRMRELGLDRRAMLSQEGSRERLESTQKFQKEQAEAKASTAAQQKGNDLAVDSLGQQQRYIAMATAGLIPKEHLQAVGSIAEPGAMKAVLDYYQFNQRKPDANEVVNLPVPNSNLVVPTIGGRQISGAPVMEQSTVEAEIPGTPSWAPMVPQLPGAAVTMPGPLKPVQKQATQARPILRTLKDEDGNEYTVQVSVGPDGEAYERPVRKGAPPAQAAPKPASKMEDVGKAAGKAVKGFLTAIQS